MLSKRGGPAKSQCRKQRNFVFDGKKKSLFQYSKKTTNKVCYTVFLTNHLLRLKQRMIYAILKSVFMNSHYVIAGKEMAYAY